MLGLFTRPVAFILSGMKWQWLISCFMRQVPFTPSSIRVKLAVLYCFVFLYMAVAGGGAGASMLCGERTPRPNEITFR